MRLELLVSVLCVVWGSVYSQKGVCLHDGYYDSTQCVCKPGFTGTSCETRICTNNGFLRSTNKRFDYGCICPPGFIGPNCQGTKCVAGDSKAFYDGQSDKMISLYVTYNMDLQTKINSSNDDPIATICDVFGNSTLYQLMISTGDSSSVTRISNAAKAECMIKFNEQVEDYCVQENDGEENPSDCPGSLNITLAQISDLLAMTTPNSQLFIVTNYPLSDYGNTAGIQTIIKTAVSRRIKINTLTFAAPGVMDYVKYQTDPGYQALRTLSESTLGVYVTPYRGTADSLMGSNTNSDVARQMINLWIGGYEAAGVFSTKQIQPQFLNVGTDDYYIHVRSLGQDDSSFFNWRKPADGMNPNVTDLDTGYWKMWKGTGSGKSISFIMGDSSQNETNFVLLSNSTSTLYPAITTADNVDASSPYLDLISVSRTFVGKVIRYGDNLSLGLSYFYPAGMLNYTFATNSNRSSCQFSTNLGTVKCSASGVSYFQLRTSDGYGSATPFYCGSSGSSDNSNTATSAVEFLEFVDEGEEDVAECTDGGSMAKQLLNSNTKRNFVIVSRNVRDIDTETNRSSPYSTSDNLYLNQGNIFSYLFKQAKAMPNMQFQHFVYNLVDQGNEQNTAFTTDKQVFMDSVVNAALNARDINSDEINTSLSWKDAINDTTRQLVTLFKQKSTGFSDIFVVIDFATQNESISEDIELLGNLYTTRSRLFILLLETYDTSLANRDDLEKLAALTGGSLFRLSDYSDLQRFFGAYFQNDGGVGLFQADTAYQLYTSKPATLPFITTDKVYLQTKLNSTTIDYTLLVYCQGNAVTVTTSDSTINVTTTFGEVGLYSLKSLPNGLYSFKVTIFPPRNESVNILILATSKDGPIPTNSIVAFSSSPTSSVDEFALSFGKSQEPVISKGNVAEFVLKNPSNEIVYNKPPIARGECSGFPNLVDYNFQCAHPNDIYYFQTTFMDDNGNTHSRTFLTQCISSSGGCLNGGNKGDHGCVCAVGFTGSVCQYPICENGGNVTSSYLCECDTDYSGFFCEISNNTCSGSPAIPDSRSEVTSLIFVVEKTGKNYGVNLAPKNLPGVQLAVIQYDCEGVYSTQLGTDASKLPSALLTTKNCTENYGQAPQALLAALDLQVTDRAVIVFVTSGSYSWEEVQRQAILNKLASQRVDLRVFTEELSTDINLLATFGNGIPFVADSSVFSDYYTKYISQLFSATVGNNARLSVVQSGTGSATFSFLADPADSSPVYFVHSNCTTNNGNSVATVTGTNTYNIQSFSFKSGVAASIKTCGIYSIEKLTTIELAFGFQTNNVNEHLQLGMSQGTNTLSLYTSSSFVGGDLTQLPTVSLKTIDTNGTFTDSELYLTSKKNDPSCIYPTYSMPITCNGSTLGYSAIITTFINSQTTRQEQKMLVCFNAAQDSCKQGSINSDDGVCTCSEGWEGLQCDIPICSSNSVLRNGVCECNQGYSGSTCSIYDFQIAPNASSQAFVFIVDSRGADNGLYDMSILSIKNFLAMFDDTQIVFMISNTGQYTGSFVKNRISDVQAQIDYLQTLRDNTNEKQDFTTTFDNILTVTNNARQNSHESIFSQSSASNNIFYTGLTGVILSNPSSLNELKEYYTVSSVYYAATEENKMVQVNSLRVTNDKNSIIANLSSNYKLVTTAYDALNFMKDQTNGASYTTPTPPSNPRTYSCVKGSLSNIFLSVEVSDVSNMDTYKKTMMDVIQVFSSDFELGTDVIYPYKWPNGTLDIRGCQVDNNRFNGQSLVSGWKFSYNSSTMQASKGFCSSSASYGALSSSINETNPTESGTPQWDSLMKFFNLQLGTCFCSRSDDTNVANIVLWLVVTDGTGATNTSVFTDGPYLHLVVPFGFEIEDDSFYDKLVKSNKLKKFGNLTSDKDYTIPNAENFTGKELVQQLWTKICHLQGLSTDTTAEPPTIGVEEMERMERFYAESLAKFTEEF